MIKVGDIVTCKDHKGLWLVEFIRKGRAFKNSYYASIVQILDENYIIPEKRKNYVCIVTLCEKAPEGYLYNKLEDFSKKVEHIQKIIKKHES